MSYLDELNESQRDAVITTDGPLMVIAGAGSGKTRVITYRIAYLIENICAPKNILAVTFTNKAAKEMKERALKIVGDGASEVTLLTFHSFCHKVLRKYAYLLGLKNSFEILDEDDSKKYIKDALDALNLDSKVYQPKMLKYYFSKINVIGFSRKDGLHLVFGRVQFPMPLLSQCIARDTHRQRRKLFGG